MAEPVMYPTTDYPKYSEKFETLDEIIQQVEALDEVLNFIVSWAIGCRQCDDIKEDNSHLMWDDGELNYFTILIFMPRKSETTEFTVNFNGDTPHAQIDNWLEGYVKSRICRWYGWTWDIEAIK